MFIDVVTIFFFKQKTAYDMRISDWSSDVCSSDLVGSTICPISARGNKARICTKRAEIRNLSNAEAVICPITEKRWRRSEEHTSELQSLMRISYAVFCLKKKKQTPKSFLNSSTNLTYSKILNQH